MNLEQKAVALYKQGYSCSESVLLAALEGNTDFSKELLIQIASPFSGGVGGSKCLCGAISGAQIALGVLYGRKSKSSSPAKIKALANKLMEDFKEKRKVTCCKVLTSKFDFNSPERKQNCALLVEESAKILESILQNELANEDCVASCI